MRPLLLAAVLAVLVVPAVAHADSFLEATGGVSIPIDDSNWTRTTESSPKLGVRVGAVGDSGLGIDILHESASGTILGTSFNSSDTDTGFAFELGGGIWYDLGSAQVGGELALPIGHHSKQGNNTDGNYTFDYTAYNIDILFGVRVMQH